MILNITIPQGNDFTLYALIINTLGIGLVGFLLSKWLTGIDRMKKLTYANERAIALHKTEIEGKVTFMQELVKKDIKFLGDSMTNLSESIKELNEKMQEKDEKLIAELKDTIKNMRHG